MVLHDLFGVIRRVGNEGESATHSYGRILLLITKGVLATVHFGVSLDASGDLSYFYPERGHTEKVLKIVPDRIRPIAARRGKRTP